MVEQYTQFKGVSSIGKTLVMNELENNLKTFLDWGFLNIGAFQNVNIPASSSFGGSFSNLKMSADPSFSTGRVWESIRKDWVWETGVVFSGNGQTMSPISISGVWVNGSFYPPAHAIYGHSYDYPNGRLIFNTPVPATSVVAMNYSYRSIQVLVSDKAQWFYEGQYESLKPAGLQWASSYPYSGDFAVPPQHRIQFPAIIVEAVPRGYNKPYELGNSALWVERDILFNIVSDTKWRRNTLIDVLSLEDNHNLWLYNTDDVLRAGMAPLNMSGMLVNPTGTYPYLVNNYRLTQCYFKEIQIAEVESINPYLHESKVRATMELAINRI